MREPVTHNLKIWPEHYSAVCAGLKRAELRKNDRDYRVGDTLDLCEWDKHDESFTGNYISVTVTHVADVNDWMPGYVLLSIELALRERAEPAYYLNQIDYGDGEGFELRAYFRELDAMKSKDDFGGVVIPAYTAPPVPVVADAAAAIRACMDEFPESVHDIVEECADIAENAFRDAMLQPVSTPYKSPRKEG
ncbi:DUF3850 domain-containing protein [Cronobacter sakazakii]|nr:DUF3850 domain-containing protein [Cronobacter sakazakii]